MAKFHSKLDKISDCFTAFKCMKEGKPVKRSGAKDGSIATKPVVSVPDLPEKVVLAQSLFWLKINRIFCNRHDAGSFQNNRGQWATYGIKDSGDIHGYLSDGRGFEIECKKGKGGRLSKGQQKRMRDVRATNGLYFVIHGISELEHYLKDLI